MTDQVTIVHTPDTAAQEAHEAAMIAKADGVPAPEVTPEAAPSGDRPTWLPEKFKSPEDMAKAYAELESKQGGKAPEVAPEDVPKDPPADPAPNEAKEQLEAKGLNLEDFSTEFSQKGELSPDSYDKLEKAGYPKAIVDQYIAGQQALASKFEIEVKSVAGGEEKFAEVQSWAAANLTDAEKIAYNKAIESGDIASAKLAVSGLTAKYNEANPTEGNLLAGRFSTAVGDKYESTAQITADMRDPRYQTDPAFRQKVADKISRSSVI